MMNLLQIPVHKRYGTPYQGQWASLSWMISTNGFDLPFYGLRFVGIKSKCLDIKLESFSSVTQEDWGLFLTFVTIPTNLGSSFTFNGSLPPCVIFLFNYCGCMQNSFEHSFPLGDIVVTRSELVCSPPFLTFVGLVPGNSFIFFPHRLSSGHLGLFLVCCDQNKCDPLSSPPYVNQ